MIENKAKLSSLGLWSCKANTNIEISMKTTGIQHLMSGH